MPPLDDDLNSFLDDTDTPKMSTDKHETPFKSLVNRIETLPPLSDTAQKILKLYSQNEDDVDVRKLARLIEDDTLLTANILGMINDPKYGFQKKITSVSQAITLFGSRIMKGFILSFVMKEHIRPDMGVYGMSNERFNDMCHLQSALLFQWYMGVDIKRAQILVPLALIMETGKVIFAQEMRASDYANLFTEEIYQAKSVEEVEDKYGGTTSYYIGGLLFEHWNFSPRYTQILKALDYADEAEDVDELDLDILDVIRTAINIKGFLDKENMEKSLALVKELGMDEANYMKAALRIKNAYDAAKQMKNKA